MWRQAMSIPIRTAPGNRSARPDFGLGHVEPPGPTRVKVGVSEGMVGKRR